MFECVICNKQFSRKSSCKRHQLNIHQKLYMESCPICAKNVRKDYLKRHLKTHQSPPDQVIRLNKEEANIHGSYNYTCINLNYTILLRLLYILYICLIDSPKKLTQPSTSGQISTMMCEVCLVEVPKEKWHHHQRTVSHKRKAAISRSDSLKVINK